MLGVGFGELCLVLLVVLLVYRPHQISYSASEVGKLIYQIKTALAKIQADIEKEDPQ